ncbi:MAG TPA: hypothetical protein VGU20_04060 [Stellaceae bacterium]|nr:hypothetical protein [Stellaceae bacterium]
MIERTGPRIAPSSLKVLLRRVPLLMAALVELLDRLLVPNGIAAGPFRAFLDLGTGSRAALARRRERALKSRRPW